MANLSFDARALGQEALRRVADADALLAQYEGHSTGHHDGYPVPRPDCVALSDGTRLPAGHAPAYASHLMRSAELLTQVAQLAAQTRVDEATAQAEAHATATNDDGDDTVDGM
jgi:hypothetical protein